MQAGAAQQLSAASSFALNRRVRQEQWALLLQSNQSASLPAFIIALVFWLVLYYQLSEPIVLIWACAMHLNQIVRYLWVVRYAKNTKTAEDPSEGSTFLIFLMGINGAVWGFASVLFLPISDVLVASFVVVVTLGIHSGGMTWMAPVKAAIISFSVPLTALLILGLIQQAEMVYWAGGVLIFLYAMTSWKYAMQHHKLLTDSLTARYEKMALAEQLAEQVQLVAEASAEKSRFLATASHDLRQPLHAMALVTAVLEHQLRSSPQHETASRLLDSVRLLSNSCDAMLDISQLDAATVQVTEAAVPLQPLFDAIHNMYSSLASERGLELRVRPTPLWVVTDAELLQRMLVNLVSNALKYTPSGGVLVIARRRKGAVWIDVQDTGLGVAPDQRERIFDEFYQVNNPGRDRALGLGIGLSIVKRLSRLLEHPVVVRSCLGRGSSFRVILPPAPPRSQANTETTQKNPLLESALPKRVLLLDDELEIQHAVVAFLKSHGIEVECASTERQALTALQEATPTTPHDVLLCDIRMANRGDGLAFAQSLPSLLTKVPKVILITGETTPENLKRMRRSGFDVLFKPVDAEKLLSALAQVSRIT